MLKEVRNKEVFSFAREGSCYQGARDMGKGKDKCSVLTRLW
jgi:hypothetical protein